MKNGSRRACSFVCLHQTLSVVDHCMGLRATSLSHGGLQSSSSLPIVNVGPSRADSSRSTEHEGERRASLRATNARNRANTRGRRRRASLFLSPQREEVASLPLHFLSQCLWVGIVPILPPLFPIVPIPHLACQNADGWDWGQADGQSTCPTAAPPTPSGIWEERLYAQSPGHGTRRLLRVAGRFPPGVGGARPDFCLLFCSKRGAPFIPQHT